MTTNDRHVIVGLSGGVDSTAAAFLLQRQGYQVTGLFLDVLGPTGTELPAAERAAAELGIELRTAAVQSLFSDRIIRGFIDTYARGETPNPCIFCNPQIKFRVLLEAAEEVGAGRIATGHYARVVRDPKNGTYFIHKAAAAAKDQSYMLYRLGPEVLSRLLLPLGELSSKEETRALVRGHRIGNADKRDSQEICFLQGGSYVDFLDANGLMSQPGDFVDEQGTVIGKHQGLHRYTIGQRKGLGTAFGRPVFVTAIDPATNTVTLGEEADLFRTSLLAGDLVFAGVPVDGERLVALAGRSLQAKIRYAAKPAEARLEPSDRGLVSVLFEEPQRAPTPGQSVVFYDGERVLGGGIIRSDGSHAPDRQANNSHNEDSGPGL